LDWSYLLRPGITQLDEECPVRLSDVDPCLAEIIIRIPEEENGLGVEFVGKQNLGEDSLCLRCHGVEIKLRCSGYMQVLDNASDEHSHVEIIDQL
jgi:hypothetical protein